MKENLELKKTKAIKKFSFNINNPYEEVVIGKDKTSKTSLVLVPSFVGKSLSYVNSFCGANGIKVNVKGNGTGTVISQSVPSGANVEDVSSITITLSGGSTGTSKNTNNQTNKNNTNTDKNNDKTDDKNDNSTSDKDDGKEEPTVPGTPSDGNTGTPAS